MPGGSKKGQRGTPRRQVYKITPGGVYRDIPLDAYAQSVNGIAWLKALDAIIPGTTELTYAQLFAIIGPPDSTAKQNVRAARVLGYDVDDPAARRAGLRFVQRYRASEQPGAKKRANVRGVSFAARQQFLADLAPTARDLMLKRYMALTRRYGLAGLYRGWMLIYKRMHRYDRHGGVTGAEMALVVSSAKTDDWEGAADEYLRQWLVDWGPEFEDNDLLDNCEAILGPDDEELFWVLRLGYPDDIGLPRNALQLLTLMEDETLAAYVDD